ncbi:MAG TPA: AsmA-like C-terminal region-containing protein [Bacteroidales bacterium]|nr:AsmA-like C-terminal region-containing protein [Bacteroidales bacterium]
MVKKILKISAIIAASLLVLLLLIPILFKGRIMEMVKTQINQHIEARVEFGALRLSLIRNFPNVSVSLSDIRVIGLGPFEADTLASVGRVAVTVDLLSLFGEGGYEIQNIRVNNPDILLKTLPDGTANWDIMKDVPEPEPIPEQPPTEPFALHLKQFAITQGSLIFDDRQNEMFVAIRNLNSSLRGDLSQDQTTIATRNTTIDSLTVRIGALPVLTRVSIDLTAQVEANMANMIFTLRENQLTLNELPLRFDGTVAMQGEDINLDLTFAALRSEFRDFLSLVPAVFMKDFVSLQTEGFLSLDGFAKGIYNENQIPAFGLNLNVENGMFRYPQLPASVNNVMVTAAISNPGGDIDHTVVDIPAFSMVVAGNPVSARINLRTPVSDPQVDAAIKGKLNLAQVGDFYPLEEGTTLRGIIDADLQARGRMSYIENNQFERFFAEGRLMVNDVFAQVPAYEHPVEISRAEFILSPRFVNMPVFSMKLGESDLGASGRIDNILGFVLTNQLLIGSFQTTSSFFNLNQLMEGMPAQETPEEPTQLSVIRVPENIDFTLRSQFDRLVFGNLNITNARGVVVVAEGTAKLENVQMNMLGGELVLNGSYSTKEESPVVDFGLNISNVDVQQAFAMLNTVRILAPVAQFVRGNFSTNLNLSSLLTDSLSPVLTSLKGAGNLRSAGLSVAGMPAMTKLAELTAVDGFRELSVRDLLLNFAFSDGKIDVQPFDLRFAQSVARISGSTFFDQTVNYIMNVEIPRAQFGGAANQVLDNLVSQANARGLQITPGEKVNLDVVIGGTVTRPEVSFGLSGMMTDAISLMRDQLQQRVDDAKQQVDDRADEIRTEVETRVQETADEARQKVQAELDARANQVMEEANIVAERIRSEARTAAERLRSEARTQAQRLEAEAPGPMAQLAARLFIAEADQRANALEDEAGRNAARVVTEAQTRADRIRAGME